MRVLHDCLHRDLLVVGAMLLAFYAVSAHFRLGEKVRVIEDRLPAWELDELVLVGFAGMGGLAICLWRHGRRLRREVERRRAAETAARDSETHYRMLFEISRDAITTASPRTGLFLSGNAAAVAMFGARDREHLTTLSPIDLSPQFQPDGQESGAKAQDMVQIAMREGSHYFTWHHRRVNGEYFPATVLLTRVALGSEPFLLATVRDVSLQVELERELQIRQRLTAIGSLASGVAHEINNPIMGIINYAQLMAQDYPAGSPSHDYAEEIVREAERIAAIIRDLMAFARQDAQSHSLARPVDLVESTVSLVRSAMHHDRIELHLTVPDDLPAVPCRSQQIQQVLMSLLTNAREALVDPLGTTAHQRTIGLTVRAVPDGEACWLRFTVEDHGPGIAPEVREHLFEPFFTTKDRAAASGLGLAFSHGIAHEHGGRLWFESEPGSFTRFHLDLPLAAADQGLEATVTDELGSAGHRLPNEQEASDGNRPGRG